MKLSTLSILLLSIIFVSGCIKDDFVNDNIDPELRIINSIDTLAINTTFQFESIYLINSIGQEEEINATWKSSRSDISKYLMMV